MLFCFFFFAKRVGWLARSELDGFREASCFSSEIVFPHVVRVRSDRSSRGSEFSFCGGFLNSRSADILNLSFVRRQVQGGSRRSWFNVLSQISNLPVPLAIISSTALALQGNLQHVQYLFLP